MITNNEWREKFLERLLDFTGKIILLTNELPKTPAGYVIANQIIRSGSSIGANYVESQDASSTKDFIQKLSISLRETRETYYWLQVIERTKLLPRDVIKNEIIESKEIIAILVSSIKKSKRKLEVKGI